MFLLLTINAMAGIMIEVYNWYNVLLSSLVLIVNGILMYLTLNIPIKTAFKIAISTLFPFFTLVQFVLSVLAPYTFLNNWYIFSIMILLLIQIILLITIYTTSKITK